MEKLGLWGVRSRGWGLEGVRVWRSRGRGLEGGRGGGGWRE